MMIAYPIHIIFIDFSQVVDGQIFPEMNVFRSLYNGVLTLFEFVFGAVIFVRPYLEQNLYTYSISFIMVIFSFFGNIMMANMLVAFLARQFEDITRKAKYYTSRMQFGLVKMFNMGDLDGIFVMPYPLTVPLLPLYILMIGTGKMRSWLNQLLRKIVHFINVFLLAFASMNIFLIILMAYRYIEITLFVLIRAPLNPMYILYLFAWLILGPFLLLKLYLQDNWTMCKILLQFHVMSQDPLATTLEENAKANLCMIFTKIYLRTKEHLYTNPDELKMTIGQFLVVLDMEQIVKTNEGKSLKGKEKDEQENVEEEDNEDDDEEGLVGFTAKFNAFYSKDESKLIVDLLKRFAIQQGKSEEVLEMVIDLEIMLEKLEGNINHEYISKLVGFDITTLYKANKLINKNDDTDVKAELIKVKERVGNMDAQIELILNEIESVKSIIKMKN